MTDDEILARAKEIEQQRAQAWHEKAAITERRTMNLWGGHVGQRYAPDDLVYAAYARCKGCQVGLAYPKDSGMHGSWHCSAILLGEARKEVAHDQLPFAFYEVKSEDQPSANGATTRPKS